MKNSLLISTLFSIALLFTNVFANASGGGKYYGLWWDAGSSLEYFVSYDPSTSTKTLVDTIPGIKLISGGASVFDAHQNRYVFIGGASSSTMAYNIIDASTGALLSQSPVVGRQVDNMVYSPNERKIYGVWWDASTATEYFVSIDPYTSTRTVLASIPEVQWIVSGNAAYDSRCDQYVFIGGTGGSATMAYIVIDAHTGATLSRSPVGGRGVDNMAYSTKDRTFVGVWWDASTTTEYFVSIDPYTSTRTILDTLADVKWIVGLYSAFNTDCNHYVFAGGPATNTSSMANYVMDATSGAVIFQSLRGGERIDNLEYGGKCHKKCVKRRICRRGHDSVEVVVEDTSSEEENSKAGDLAGAPVPSLTAPARQLEKPFILSGLSSGDIVLQTGGTLPDVFSFDLLDLSGKALFQMNDIRTRRIRINGAPLKKGIYLFRIRSGRTVAAAGKLAVK